MLEIHTDSEVALAAWQDAALNVPGPWPDLDGLLREVYNPDIVLHKVRAHDNLDELCGMPQWLAAGNAVADAAAKQALALELALVQTISDEGYTCLQEQKDLLGQFWRYLLQLSLEERRLMEQVETGQRSLPADVVTEPRPWTNGCRWIRDLTSHGISRLPSVRGCWLVPGLRGSRYHCGLG